MPSEASDGTIAADSGSDWQGTEANALTDNGLDTRNVDGATTTSQLLISGFSTSIPAGSTIDGIVIRLDSFWGSDGGGTCAKKNQSVSLSWDGGTNYTLVVKTKTPTSSETSTDLGSATDKWGRVWAVSELGSNFKIKMTGARATCLGTGIFHAVEYITRTIYYTEAGVPLYYQNWAPLIFAALTKILSRFFGERVYLLSPLHHKETLCLKT